MVTQTQGQIATPTIAPSVPVIKEVEPGKHYSVLLPAKGTVQVASVLLPVGEVGANTTVQWAVEVKIGEELIGGMMHELTCPTWSPTCSYPPSVRPARWHKQVCRLRFMWASWLLSSWSL